MRFSADSNVRSTPTVFFHYRSDSSTLNMPEARTSFGSHLGDEGVDGTRSASERALTDCRCEWLQNPIQQPDSIGLIRCDLARADNAVRFALSRARGALINC